MSGCRWQSRLHARAFRHWLRYRQGAPADAVILAVAHGSYVEGGWPLIQKLLSGGAGLAFDVKMELDRGSKPAGIELLQL